MVGQKIYVLITGINYAFVQNMLRLIVPFINFKLFISVRIKTLNKDRKVEMIPGKMVRQRLLNEAYFQLSRNPSRARNKTRKGIPISKRISHTNT